MSFSAKPVNRVCFLLCAARWSGPALGQEVVAFRLATYIAASFRNVAAPGEPANDAVTASDHWLVWIDVRVQ